MDSNSYSVYLGFWTNWSHGKINGVTWTLTRQDGGLLIAFLAIFLGAAGRSFWRISCFFIHRLLSTSAAEDALYHQRQAILRNSDTAFDGFWRLLETSYGWRKRDARPFRRLLPLCAYAFVIALCFAVAGIFSSRVTTDTVSEVLLTGKNCASMGLNDLTNLSYYGTVWAPYNTQRVMSSLNYVNQCYRNGSENSDECHLFIKPQIPSTVITNASCPFASEVCRTQDANIIVDTGYIDSHEHLGINSPPQERFQIRSKYQCAPIVTEGFNELVNSTEIPGLTLRRYFYGGMSGNNFTYEVPTREYSPLNYDNYTWWMSARPEYGIGISAQYSVTNEGNAASIQWQALPQFKRDDADVSIYFLSAPGILFTEESNDLWFAAHQKGVNISNEAGQTAPSFMMDDDASVLACARQYQICNPNMPEGQRCQPLRGWLDNSYRLDEITQNEQQRNRLQYIRDEQIGNNDETHALVVFAGMGVLQARDRLSYGMQGPLESNQWQLEVEHWVKGSMASLQRIFVNKARGPMSNELREYFSAPPNNTEESKMCRNQKIVSSLYSSFNVLGLVIIFVLGGILILLDWFMEYLIDYYQKTFRPKRPDYASAEWNATATIQLQRLAHEGLGLGHWSRVNHLTPVTLPGEKLGVLDIEDAKHPLLRPPPDWKPNVAQDLRRQDTERTEVEDEKAWATDGPPFKSNA
ncbi:hypothetical protein K491DRAFT_774588 [Lophiostoma macrostomum CBS 122681]|uniref:Uncharacterized protein n=1 Tax=Lophiostoma macrostomum CBS 122681 TaxID=1314788 RepID=A0A6A6TP09_9PLEO|nr:hypothetical protein K491DRAFT_774588 [Lophiostoma macrostomum CBS 122681]